MAAPIFRRWTFAQPAALNAFALATDDITAETNYLLATQNELLDMVSDPAPGAGVAYEVDMMKNGIPNGRNFFSRSLDPASAGRVAIGPISLLAGKIQFNVAQRLGALAAYSFLSKFIRP